MSELIIYVDQSEVREGKLGELEAAMRELVAFVEAHEPQIPAYHVFFSEDRARMTVIHIHTDSASLAFHMRVAGQEFPKFAEFIRMVSIDIYGKPGDELVAQLRQKAEMLGSGEVRVHDLHAGVAHLAVAATR